MKKSRVAAAVVVVAVVVAVVAFAFLVVIPSVARNLLSPVLCLCCPAGLLVRIEIVWSVLVYSSCGSANEEREKAGSLATLGMTNQKSKSKGKGKSRFPAGMTNQKSKSKSKGKSRFPAGMTNQKSKGKGRGRGKAQWLFIWRPI